MISNRKKILPKLLFAKKTKKLRKVKKAFLKKLKILPKEDPKYIVLDLRNRPSILNFNN